jgi:hypothetical protein
MSLFKSSNNSFQSQICAPDESLTGTFEIAYDFHGIISNVVTTGTSFRLEVQFSDNGTTVIKTIDITDDNHCHIEATYIRIVFTNTSVSSETVDIHTYLSINPINTASSTIGQQILQSSLLTDMDAKLASPLHVIVDNEEESGASLEATQLLVKQEIINMSAKLPTSLGVKPTTGSVSVVIAPDSNPIAVSLDDLPLPSNASTESTLLLVKDLQDIANSTLTTGLGSINTRLQGWDSAITSIATTSQQTAGRLPSSIGQKSTAQSLSVCLSSDTPSMPITTSTPLFVKAEQYGSFGNLSDNISLTPLASTSALNITNFAYIYGFYEDTSTSSSAALAIEFSFDGVTFLNSNTSIYPSTSDSKRRASIYKAEVAGINYMRVKNTSVTDSLAGVTVTILGASLG